ncbi:MAG: hypothetical protein Q8N78_11200 [Sulfurimonas sp.]|nr:hypothetical protein [Sulfurimonas sp.]
MENILDFNNYNSWMPTIKSIVDKYEIQYLVNKFENYDKYLEKRDVERINQYARNIFNEKDFPEITDDIFQKALDKQDTERREEKGLFVLFLIKMNHLKKIHLIT